MKNLSLYSVLSTYKIFNGQIEPTIDLKDAQGFCVDAANALTYFAMPNVIICVDKNMDEERRIEWNGKEHGKLIMFDFLVDDMEICAIFENGTILLVSTWDGNSREEPVLFDQKVVGGSWSPDLGLLVIATTDKLLAITRNFEIEHEKELYTQDPGKEQLQTIGWGARETQFQGQAGRQKREKIDENTVPGPLSANDKKEVLISWRGDAQYFTVSTVEMRPNPRKVENSDEPESLECRHLRVWSRDLELMSQCEELAGMENVLSMRPTGNLMAVTRTLHEKRDVWLYERNGQWRNHFNIGNSNGQVMFIGWNSDSTVLGLHLKKDGFDYLQFWTVSNYDWTMKIELKCEEIKGGNWDPENPYRFHFLTMNGRYDIIEMEAIYNSDDTTVIAVAGNQIRVTDLKKSPIPPPMSHYQLNIGSYGVQLVKQEEGKLAILTSDGKLITYYGKNYETKIETELKRSTTGIAYNLIWMNDENISLIADNRIYQYNIKNGEEQIIYETTELPMIYQQFIKNEWFIQTNDGTWYKMNNDGLLEEIGIEFRSINVHKCKIIKFEENVIIFGLNRNNQLLINGNVAHQSIGSWHFENEGFLVTSLNNVLYGMTYLELLELLKNPPKMTPKNALYGWFNDGAGRSIERGALLICSETNGVKVHLQMPRGNFETIEPRFRLIPWLKKMISNQEYDQAIKLMRRQRVDMNLLFDHDPEAFKRNVVKFVDEIDDAELLNLFVFGLNAIDSTRNSFLPYYSERKDTPEPINDKIQIVSQLVMETILNIMDTERRLKLYTVALSCFLIREPRIVKDAFLNMKQQILSSGQKLEQTNEQFIQQKPSLFRKWTKHLKYFVKDLDLWRGSLMTYDLTLAYEVADTINMDPREYLPLLDNFKEKLPKEYQKYHIDLYVENYISALENISKVDEKIDECIQHIKKYNLYSESLKIFHGTKNFKKIAKICANHLFLQRKFDEAGILYEKSEEYLEAVKSYENGLNLDGFLYSSKKANLDSEVIKKSLKLMSLKFEQQGKYGQVAKVLTNIGIDENFNKIIEFYGKSLEWKNVKLILKNNDEINGFKEGKEKLLEIVYTRIGTILEESSKMKSDILKYSTRLEIIRNQKEKSVDEWIENEGEIDVAQSETMSEISTTSGMSNISRLSRMSTAQAKRRQNVEKKKKTVKEGSQYEDIGILNALTVIVGKLNNIQKEMEEFLPLMIDLDLLKEAKVLQDEIIKLVKLMGEERIKIWPRYIKSKHLTGPMVEIYRCEDGLVRIPGEGHMPTRIYLEDEMMPPKLETSFVWKLNCLE